MTLHKDKPKGIIKDRQLFDLVMVEEVSGMPEAIERQSELKKMSKDQRRELIEKVNPTWRKMNGDY